MTSRSKAILSTRAALDATDARLKDAPAYGVYVHAKSQLDAMLKLLTDSAPITPAQKRFVDIGLMAAKELEAAEPEYADALMLAAYEFQNTSDSGEPSSSDLRIQNADAPSATGSAVSRCDANEPCPQAGFWFTPAKVGSRRYYKSGEVMPEVGGDYGVTIWQWDQNQDPPKL